MKSDMILIGEWRWKYRVKMALEISKTKVDDLMSVIEKYLFVHSLAV